ncbi:MAG: pyridine nucleotide-disulfide oxidoreductase, partial [Gemmatimonadetes bacterium]|nr:pyridine nucleotide-disulfide oxidoreductase [Gemmatimonadota bacterium]
MRDLVLVGGGHAHLEALLRLARRAPVARVRLVSDRPFAVYSGMVPGVLEGRYEPDAASIDLASFAARAGAAFTCARVVEVGAQEVRTAQGDRLPFDVLSLDVGS